MKAPPEFYRLAQAFQFATAADAKDEREWIASALQRLDPRSKRVVKRFLTDLLGQNPDEAELQELWKSADNGYYIVGKYGNDGVRHVLMLIRDAIE